ncbi:MAG: hypothetical protein N5P05_004080 (plasmid) [Chroococcopsis gigantea SAG 12.99]|jgi:hypothetical protein|nr:hypothetical protein [Chroococcopsis gigantea SAG 12.99]
MRSNQIKQPIYVSQMLPYYHGFCRYLARDLEYSMILAKRVADEGYSTHLTLFNDWDIGRYCIESYTDKPSPYPWLPRTDAVFLIPTGYDRNTTMQMMIAMFEEFYNPRFEVAIFDPLQLAASPLMVWTDWKPIV